MVTAKENSIMAKNVVNTSGKAFKFIKPDYIVLTLFTGAETDGTPLGDSYILEDVIEDTTSIAQDDNETTDIECETSDAPLITIVKMGKYQVAAEIGDTQSDLLCAICGFIKDTTGSRTIAPSTYTPIYAKFDIVKKSADGKTMVAYVVPKAQLNSKVTIDSLNSNLARIALAGTGHDIDVSIGGKTYKTSFYVSESYTLPTGE